MGLDIKKKKVLVTFPKVQLCVVSLNPLKHIYSDWLSECTAEVNREGGKHWGEEFS